MKTYEVHISLRNGQEFIFFKNAKDENHILHEFREMSDAWYHFVSKEYVDYRVLKEEIVSIGITMSLETAQEFEATLHN